MKNITLAIEEDVLREARKIAAERETTVIALVREYLGNLACQKANSAGAREGVFTQSKNIPARWLLIIIQDFSAPA